MYRDPLSVRDHAAAADPRTATADLPSPARVADRAPRCELAAAPRITAPAGWRQVRRARAAALRDRDQVVPFGRRRAAAVARQADRFRSPPGGAIVWPAHRLPARPIAPAECISVRTRRKVIRSIAVERRRSAGERASPRDSLTTAAAARYRHDFPSARSRPSGESFVRHDQPIGHQSPSPTRSCNRQSTPSSSRPAFRCRATVCAAVSAAISSSIRPGP
jgi:hypothetical protein